MGFWCVVAKKLAGTERTFAWLVEVGHVSDDGSQGITVYGAGTADDP